MSFKVVRVLTLGAVASAFSLHASAVTVTVNLGPSAENFVQYGQGPNAAGRGLYAFDQGDCTSASGNVTCILSGSFTGTSAGFTLGTYELVTEHFGSSGPSSPILGIQSLGNPNFFNYRDLDSADITLRLSTSSGSFRAAAGRRR